MLGEADLVDTARRRGLDEALHGFERVHDPLVRVAQMHVVVEDHSGSERSSQDSTRARSSARRHLQQPRVTLDHGHAATLRLDERRAVRRIAPTRDCVTEDRCDECLRRLNRAELVARERLDDGFLAHPFDRVRRGQPRDGSVPTLVQRCNQALDHRVGDQRPGGVVDEDHGCVVGHLRHADANGSCPRLAAADRGDHLPAPQLLGEQDHRLLPPGGSDDHDRVDPRGCFQPLETLREERPTAKLRERLGLVRLEPLAAAGGGEHGPDGQRPPAPRARRSLPRSPWRSSSCRSRRWRARRPARLRPRPRPSPWRT